MNSAASAGRSTPDRVRPRICSVPPEVCKIIRNDLAIPVYSIGAGSDADGQLMISSDVLGIFQVFTPKFVKRSNELGNEIRKTFEAYVDDVKHGRFPEEVHTYRMVEGELPRLMDLMKD